MLPTCVRHWWHIRRYEALVVPRLVVSLPRVNMVCQRSRPYIVSPFLSYWERGSHFFMVG